MIIMVGSEYFFFLCAARTFESLLTICKVRQHPACKPGLTAPAAW